MLRRLAPSCPAECAEAHILLCAQTPSAVTRRLRGHDAAVTTNSLMTSALMFSADQSQNLVFARAQCGLGLDGTSRLIFHCLIFMPVLPQSCSAALELKHRLRTEYLWPSDGSPRYVLVTRMVVIPAIP